MTSIRREFRSGSLRLAADSVVGSGTPWVFLHGLASSRLGFKGSAFLEFAARTGRTLYRVDLRGHGESEGSLATTTLSDLCADVRSVMAEIGPCALVGSSLGGLVAAWAAAHQPDSVRALTLLAPAVGIVDSLIDGGAWLGSGDPIPIGPHVIEDARGFDEQLLPTRLTMPVLTIHGADDPVVRAADVEQLHGRIPHADKELWMIEGGDHGLGDFLPEILERTAAFVDAHRGD